MDKTELGVRLVIGSLLAALVVIIYAAIADTGSWWFLLAVPVLVGLVLIWWDQFRD